MLIPVLCVAASARDPFRPWIRGGSRDLVELLLGGSGDTACDFVSSAFGTQAYTVRDSQREDRISWARSRRRWLPRDDVDSVLMPNASALSRAPLRLGEDVELEHGESRIASHCANCADIVDIGATHTAFQDGFVLRIRHMHHRVAQMAAVVQAVRAAMYSDVHADLLFAPPPPPAKKANTHKALHNAHAFYVQLDGAQTVHVRANGVSSHQLAEGDVLYVPAGSIVERVGSPRQLSLHIELRAIDVPTRLDALHVAIAAFDDPVLEEHLPDAQYTWRHLLRRSAVLAGTYVPTLRMPLPVAPYMTQLIHAATGISPIEAVAAEIIRFAAAAQQGELLTAALAEIAENGEGDIKRWAAQLHQTHSVGRNSLTQIEHMFALCVTKLAAHAHEIAPQAVRTMRESAVKRAFALRPKLIQVQLDALQRHGQQVVLADDVDSEESCMSEEEDVKVL